MNPIKLIAALILISSAAQSQTVSCSDFSITNIYGDTINSGDYQISIYWDTDPFDIINYPIVSTLVDCNGDTVATGGQFYFGQLGQTTQDYPVTLTGIGSINCLPLTASFIVNYALNQTDTCQLTFNPTGMQDFFVNGSTVSIYPNPATSFIEIGDLKTLNDVNYVIYDLIGRPVIKGILMPDKTTISIEELTSGTYYLKLENRGSHAFKVIHTE